MPVIGISAGLPGSRIGADIKLAHQTQQEKETDLAIEVQEQGNRDLDAINDAAGARADTLHRLLSTASPLDRFADKTNDGPL